MGYKQHCKKMHKTIPDLGKIKTHKTIPDLGKKKMHKTIPDLGKINSPQLNFCPLGCICSLASLCFEFP
jgi:hypothetical protein